MHIDHDSAEFPYLQLANQLRAAIISGEYPPGRKMPSIEDIIAQTGLSPMTIRRAYALLAREGRVTVIAGRGTFASLDSRGTTS